MKWSWNPNDDNDIYTFVQLPISKTTNRMVNLFFDIDTFATFQFDFAHFHFQFLQKKNSQSVNWSMLKRKLKFLFFFVFKRLDLIRLSKVRSNVMSCKTNNFLFEWKNLRRNLLLLLISLGNWVKVRFRPNFVFKTHWSKRFQWYREANFFIVFQCAIISNCNELFVVTYQNYIDNFI